MPQPPVYSRPDGFPDRSPQVCQSFRKIEQQLMEFFGSLSFEEVSPPVLEYADLYTSGFVGRQRVGDLFEVPMDQGRDFPALSGGGRQTSWDAVLRPDLTSPMARMFLCNWLGQPEPPAAPHPVRWISAGPVFRRVAPGRFNEQRQVGVEWFCPPPLPSPDMLRPAVMMLKWALVLTGRLQGAVPAEVRIGHRGLMLALLPGVPADQRERLWGGIERLRQARHWAQRATDGKLAALWRDHPQWQRRAGIAAPDAGTIRRLLPSLEEAVIHAAWRGAGVDPAALEPLVRLDSLGDLMEMAAARPDPDGAIAEILTVLRQTRDTVAKFGPPGLPLLLSADPSRGFGYYDGLTFEIHGARPGDQSGGSGDARKRRWVGGGRYRLDALAARIAASTGLPLPPAALSGVGMAFDLDNLTGAAL